MVSRERLFVSVVLVYIVAEVVVDNVLIYRRLTGGRVPSITLCLLTTVGLELGSHENLPNCSRRWRGPSGPSDSSSFSSLFDC